MVDYSDFVVYADESGDHGLVSIDPQYPVFALVFCVMRKIDYAATVVPAILKFKFGVWGHDAVVLHEHDIRKSNGPFAILMTDRALRERFHDDLNRLMEAMPMTIFAAVIDKPRLRSREDRPANPYRIALRFCMKQLHGLLGAAGQQGKAVHVVFESRGRKEDRDLELEFRRIAASRAPRDFGRFALHPIFVSKAANSVGLQLADLTARPIALSQLRPNQPNRAFDIIRPKIGAMKCLP